MKIFYSLLIFTIALQLTAYLFWAFDIFGGLVQYPLGTENDLVNLGNVFSISGFSVLIGIGGAFAIGLAALLLRQGTYAIYAMLLWAIGMQFNFVRDFFLVIPNTFGVLIPAEANPDPTVFLVNPILVVVGVIFTFAAYWWMFGLVIQRDLN